MGDRGIPKSWRHMNGYSSHTYMWVNANGERFWVKYHFKTDQGIEFLTQEDADRIAGEDGDYHRRDLFEAIGRGDYPSWTLRVQIMPFEEARTYRFNPFDLTKVWPHGDYPLHEVGRLTLDRNPTDFHAEIEQAAFEPNNLVPGIGVSPDKMLLARVFSYADAHRARMGVNYKQIPVNAPKVPVHSYSKDGAMRIHKVADPSTPRTQRAGRRPTPSATPSWRDGRPTASSSMPPTPCAGTTTTGARRARWSARSWTTANAIGWSPTWSAPEPRRLRAGPRARVRLLAQHRQDDRRPHRRRRGDHLTYPGVLGLRGRRDDEVQVVLRLEVTDPDVQPCLRCASC